MLYCNYNSKFYYYKRREAYELEDKLFNNIIFCLNYFTISNKA